MTLAAFTPGQKLGLHGVGHETFERTPKPSAGVYAALVRGARAESAAGR